MLVVDATDCESTSSTASTSRLSPLVEGSREAVDESEAALLLCVASPITLFVWLPLLPVLQLRLVLVLLLLLVVRILTASAATTAEGSWPVAPSFSAFRARTLLPGLGMAKGSAAVALLERRRGCLADPECCSAELDPSCGLFADATLAEEAS